MSNPALKSAAEITQQFEGVFSLIVSTSALFGASIFILGLYSVYKNSENPSRYPMDKAFKFIVSGSLLLAPLAFFQVILATVTVGGSGGRSALAFNDLSAAADQSLSGSAYEQYMPEQLWAIVMGFLFCVGAYAFIKGLAMIRNIGSNDDTGQMVSGRKVIQQLAFAMICMHIGTVVSFVLNSFLQ